MVVKQRQLPLDGIEMTPDGGARLLILRCGPCLFGASATRIYPSHHNLLLCAEDLANGRDSVTCRWMAEPGGYFLDFTRIEDTLHLVVHEMDPTPDGVPPVRGHACLVVRTAVREFLSKLCTAFRDLEAIEAAAPHGRRFIPVDLSRVEAIEGIIRDVEFQRARRERRDKAAEALAEFSNEIGFVE